VGAFLCCAASSAAAQTPVPPTAAADAGLSLEDVLRTTLRDNPSIQVAARQADTERGVLVAAGDAFDAKLQSAFGSNRFNTLRGDAIGSRSPWLETSQTQYSVGIQKQLRQGIIVSPELDVSRTALPTLDIQPTSQATAKLSVLVPMLKDRGGFVTSASERAAAPAYEATKFQTQHVTAQAILTAVTAYWDYQAAITRLSVLTDSERRAQRLFEDTRRLVEGGERPPSDLTQVQGNLAAKRVTRISAEQAVVDTRVRLGLVMGVGPAETAALGHATTPFPAAEPAGAEAIATPALVDQALGARPDLRATEKSVESARVLFDAARENLKPRVDMVTSIGYAGLQIGGGRLTSLFSPVFSNVPGPDVSIAFRYQWATSNVGARGVLLQTESTYEQERITRQELQRQIRTGVYQASESIGRNATAMAEAHQAVSLYEATVRSEQRKFQLGVSTLFDTIQAADALTNVKLSEISIAREYAVALATLRFQTGSLIGVGPRGATVDAGRLVSPR
jgi:outer membrane protein